jgi:transmembrane sensor
MEELILRFLNGQASPFEVERLKKWRAADPANEAQFESLEQIWALSEPPSPGTSDPAEVLELAKAVMAEAETRREAANEASRPTGHRRPTRSFSRGILPWSALLAASVAALSLGIFSSGNTVDPEGAPDAPMSITLTAQTLRLDDGSFVRLGPGSELQASVGGDRRVVQLMGRAFFAVAPDESRPFLVQVGDAEVKVLGTRFEVWEGEELLRTVVVEGRVAMETKDGEVEIPAGSVGHARPGAPPSAERVPDVLSLLDWPGGLLVFHDTPIRDVAREVERHFQIPIRVVPLTNGNPRVSASFEADESFREVLETLCTVTGSECRIAADSAVIGPQEMER